APLNLGLETSGWRPGNLGAAAGGVGGQLLAVGNPFAAAAAVAAGPTAYEARDRVKFGVPLVLGAVPGFGSFATVIGGAAAAGAGTPKPLPPEAVRPTLLKALTSQTAPKLPFGAPFDPKSPPGDPQQLHHALNDPSP